MQRGIAGDKQDARLARAFADIESIGVDVHGGRTTHGECGVGRVNFAHRDIPPVQISGAAGDIELAFKHAQPAVDRVIAGQGECAAAVFGK